MPPPLLPRLDLPYFTVIHYWIKGSGENCLYVTAAPPDGAELATGDLAEPEPYPFERVAYGDLLRHLGEHPLLQPLLDLRVKPNLRASLLSGSSVVPLEEISSGRVLERPVGLNGQGLERLQVVILRTPAGPSFNPPPEIRAVLRASFIYFQVIHGPRSSRHANAQLVDYENYIFGAHNMEGHRNPTNKALRYFP